MRRALRWIPPALLSAVLLVALRGTLVYLGIFLPPFFIPTPVMAAASHVEGIASISANVTAQTITFTQAVTSGDFLVAFVRNCTALSVSDNINGAWTAADPNEDNQIFYFASSTAAGANGLGVTASVNPSCNLRMVVDHFAGYVGKVTVEGVSNGIVSGTAGNASTTGAVSAGDLVYAGARFGDNNITITAGSTNGQAMTIGAQQTTAGTGTVGSEYALSSAAGVQNSDITVTPSVGGGPMDQAAFLFTVAQSSTASVGAPSNLPLLGVGGLGSSSPPGGGSITTSSGSRDPALQPFATNSIWNYPIGSGVLTTTTVGTGFWGNTWAGLAANGKVVFPQVQSFSVQVLIGKNSDPLQTMAMPGSYTQYNSQCFSRHFPASGFPQPTGENEDVVVTPDHLTSMDMYDMTFTTGLSGAGYPACAGAGWYNAATNAATGNGISVNVDLMGPGIWNGAGLDGTGDGGIILGTGDEAAPTNTLGKTNGQAITFISQEPAVAFGRLAGLIRSGELANGINHAMVISVLTGMLNKNTPANEAHVWPAAGQDGDGSSYGTTGPLYAGGLVMIPPGTCAGHTFDTVSGVQPGKNICLALERYGAYVADTSGANILQIEYNASGNDPMPTTADDTFITQSIVTVTNSYAAGNGTTVSGSATSAGGPPRVGFKIDQGDGTVNSSFLASAFSATFGGGNGRQAYHKFKPYIPDSIWAWITKRVLH